jgi:hypothetical protein
MEYIFLVRIRNVGGWSSGGNGESLGVSVQYEGVSAPNTGQCMCPTILAASSAIP